MDYDDKAFYKELTDLCRNSSYASRVNNGDIIAMLELVKQGLLVDMKVCLTED